MTEPQVVDKRILVVDDENENIKLIGTILYDKGYLVSIASNGSQALEFIEQNLPDLILLDVMMPDMDGFETCRSLKKNPVTKNIPLIFLTALTNTVDKVRGFKAGAVDFLTKPIEPEEMLVRISTHLKIKDLHLQLEKANSELEQKVLERTGELAKAESFLKNIINSMPSVIIGVDISGTVTHWNNQAEIISGRIKEDVLGKPLKGLFPILEKELEKVSIVISGFKKYKSEKVPVEYNGELHYFDIALYPLSTSSTDGVVIRIDDVTERVQIEKMMIDSVKMLTLGGLSTGLSTEINNPLSGILQNIQVIRNRFSADHEKNKEAASDCGISMEALISYLESRNIFKLMEDIGKSGERAANIVSKMLNFSRKSDLSYSSNDLRELLDKTIEFAEIGFISLNKYDLKEISIEREYDEVPEIRCVSNQIQQVFLNIIKNSYDAMTLNRINTDTDISEECNARFIFRVKKEVDIIRVEIEDNGPGITEEISKHIFEPFFTTKGVEAGTDLGLSVSHFIIKENHKGTLTVSSTPGIGTKFIIRLPI